MIIKNYNVSRLVIILDTIKKMYIQSIGTYISFSLYV